MKYKCIYKNIIYKRMYRYIKILTIKPKRLCVFADERVEYERVISQRRKKKGTFTFNTARVFPFPQTLCVMGSVFPSNV